jgi:hypothetical protein
MTSAPPAAIDVLRGLLEAEMDSLLRCLEHQFPYVSRATADVHRRILAMLPSGQKRLAELSAALERLGELPSPARVHRSDQYLGFLSMAYLLPKLVSEAESAVRLCEQGLSALPDGPREVTDLLQRHLAEHREHLRALREAAPPATN